MLLDQRGFASAIFGPCQLSVVPVSGVMLLGAIGLGVVGWVRTQGRWAKLANPDSRCYGETIAHRWFDIITITKGGVPFYRVTQANLDGPTRASIRETPWSGTTPI